MAELRGWTQFVALQIEYSLIQRTPERDLIPMANYLDLAITPWATIGGGALTGKYLNKKDKEPARLTEKSVRLNQRNTEIAREVVSVAEELGVKPSQIAINWVRQQKGNFIPIVGARTPEQLSESLGCLNFKIPDTLMQRLNTISYIEYGFPHDFLNGEIVRDLAYSGQRDKIVDHRGKTDF
jgi:aryl-alcohol dehydrogenase-like predicted oxidoreductase